MMKAGTDWRKASRQYSRERFNSLSMKLMRDGSLNLANDNKWTNYYPSRANKPRIHAGVTFLIRTYQHTPGVVGSGFSLLVISRICFKSYLAGLENRVSADVWEKKLPVMAQDYFVVVVNTAISFTCIFHWNQLFPCKLQLLNLLGISARL